MGGREVRARARVCERARVRRTRVGAGAIKRAKVAFASSAWRAEHRELSAASGRA